MRYKVGNIYDKQCKHCDKIYKVEILQRLRGNGRFENRLIVIGDGRQFQGLWCPECTTPQKRGEKEYKRVDLPRTPSVKAPTPAQWCSRGQYRRIEKIMSRHHPEVKWTLLEMVGATGKGIADWIESKFYDHPETGDKMRW